MVKKFSFPLFSDLKPILIVFFFALFHISFVCSTTCPSIDLRLNGKFNFSPKHLPRKASNLLKSEVALSQDEEEPEGDCLELDTNSSEEEEAVSILIEDNKPDYSQVPIAGALFVATCLGTPVIALTGLKMGIFAAVGGGVMGFATGKMFAEHE